MPTFGNTGHDRAPRDPDHEVEGEHVAMRETTRHDRDEAVRERFGGVNGGAAFLGWLVAVAVAVLLAGIVGVVAAALGDANNITQTDAEREAGSIGLAAAITSLVVLAIAYYTGGYVAGRMSRFDGARQGVAVWVIGLVLMLLVGIVGFVFGREYNVFDRVNLPSVPISSDTATTGGIVTAVAILLVTLLSAAVGGKVGRRYHHKVDRAFEW